MSRLSIQERSRIIELLVEENRLRVASRLADCAINAVTKLLRSVGAACAEYQDRTLRHLSCKRVQGDEIWSFVYARQTARIFIDDPASRRASRVQLTSDGHRHCMRAIEGACGGLLRSDPDVGLVDITGNEAQSLPVGNPASAWGIVMKIKPIVIGLAVSLVLPLAGAHARAIVDSGRNLSGATVDLQSGVVQTDENFRRMKGSRGKGSCGSKGSHGSKSPNKPPKNSKKCSKKKSKKK